MTIHDRLVAITNSSRHHRWYPILSIGLPTLRECRYWKIGRWVLSVVHAHVCFGKDGGHGAQAMVI
jgi:hypothetical protein